MSAEMGWGAAVLDAHDRLGHEPRSGPPWFQVALVGDREAELFYLARDDAAPPQSVVLRYDRRACECGEASMYRFAGAFDNLEAARREAGLA